MTLAPHGERPTDHPTPAEVIEAARIIAEDARARKSTLVDAIAAEYPEAFE